MPEMVKFKKGKSEFYSEVSKRVNAYFTEKGISKHADWRMVIKTLSILTALGGSYYLVMFGPYQDNTLIQLGLWVALGFSCAFTAVNIGHDAIHEGYSSKKWVNQFLSHSFNFLGASAYMWKTMHNNAHHMYTNINGHDEDLETLPIIRLSPEQKKMGIHKYQHYYAWLFYGLASFSWVFLKDYKKFFSSHIGSIKNNHSGIQYFYLFFYKAIYYTLFIVVPFVMIDQPWHLILSGFLIMHYFQGVTLALIFMMAHLVEKVEFPVPNDQGSIENAWAWHQMVTTADFGRKDLLSRFFTGGLNYQVEHHLFPRTCHIHYPAISKIVERTAKDYNVPYLDNRSFYGALASHFRFMRELGKAT